MMYVYLLKSLVDPQQHYVGITQDLRARLVAHNSGESIHTNKFMPWKIETYLAFSDIEKANNFEKYLKHGSGLAFLKRHLL